MFDSNTLLLRQTFRKTPKSAKNCKKHAPKYMKFCKNLSRFTQNYFPTFSYYFSSGSRRALSNGHLFSPITYFWWLEIAKSWSELAGIRGHLDLMLRFAQIHFPAFSYHFSDRSGCALSNGHLFASILCLNFYEVCQFRVVLPSLSEPL